MNAVASTECFITAAAGGADPVYFRSQSRSIFGWLHRASVRPQSGIGVIICKPFGFEAISSHLSVKAFAQGVADGGVPALRFDCAGTGDSDDLDPAADQLQAWLDDLEAAVSELKRLTGVTSICLLGFRLGALLAALGAARCKDVQAVIALAPIVSGRRYISELRMFERAAQQRLAVLHSAAAPGEAPQGKGAPMEVSGFLLSAATVEALQGVALDKAEGGATRYLIIDRTDLPAARGWADKLAGAGRKVDYQAMPGFIEMMMRPPDQTLIPTDIIAAVVGWLGELRAAAPAGLPVALMAGAVLGEMPVGPADNPGAVVEHPVRFASEPQLFGILTRPAAAERRRRGVILLNSGGDYHIGPRGMHVSLARRWARRGLYVLRMDLEGLGDSDTRAGQPGNVVFPPSAIDDIRLAVEHLRSAYGVEEVTLGGMCSGAFHSLRAAVAELPVDRILMVNPLNFFWEEDMTFDTVQSWEATQKPAEYRRQLFSAHAWRRVLGGQVNLWRIIKVYLKAPTYALRSRLRNVARALRIRLKDDLAYELKKVADAGIGIVFVFSRDDAGLNLLQMETGLSVKALQRRYRLRIVDGDHNFTRSSHRLMLEQVLSEELFSSQVSEVSGVPSLVRL